MEKLSELLAKYNFEQRDTAFYNTLPELEHRLGFIFPGDYKWFLTSYKGYEDFIGPEYVRLWDLKELSEMNSDYEIIENLPNTLGIGSNGAGELIAIEMSEEHNARIVLTPFINLDSEYHIDIGVSFTDFIERLDNGRRWFDEEINADE